MDLSLARGRGCLCVILDRFTIVEKVGIAGELADVALGAAT